MSKKAIPRPVYRSPTGRYVLWPDVIRRAKQSPHTWWLLFSDVPEATVRAVRYREHPDLKRDDGRLEAELRNPHTTETNSHPHGDLFVRWIPREESNDPK